MTHAESSPIGCERRPMCGVATSLTAPTVAAHKVDEIECPECVRLVAKRYIGWFHDERASNFGPEDD